MQEVKERIAFLELRTKESEFLIQQEFESVVDSYSPSGILNAVMENDRVSKKKWLVLAVGIGLSAFLRKYLLKPKEEPVKSFFRTILNWFGESNEDLIDKGMDYIKHWIKGRKGG